MDKIIFENFRCFRSRHEVPLAPLTLLVGENSTGKTSFLAAIRLAWDIGAGRMIPDFNEEPFQLGSFNQIAHFRGGRGGRAGTFSLGYSISIFEPKDKKKPSELRCIVEFRKKGPDAEFSSAKVEHKEFQLEIHKEEKNENKDAQTEDSFQIKLKTESGEYNKQVLLPQGLMGIIGLPFFSLTLFPLIADQESKEPKQFSKDKGLKRYLRLIEPTFEKISPRPYAIAPVRTQPLRTYNQLTETPKSAGEHIPYVLAKIKNQDPKRWEKIRMYLTEFGSACGLFKGLDVDYLRKPLVDAFQMSIKVAGHKINLIDVGYGVSQVLPILVESFLRPDRQILLFQQPEIHLHPRAQAELGSLFGKIAKERKDKLIVETHSDYLIDRIRLDIRDKKDGFISHKDVIILYFTWEDSEVKIYPISIGPDGNIEGAPRGYRSFFLDEEERFLDY